MTDGFAIAPDGVRIAWRGDGPADAPAVFFCSMGTAALAVWDPAARPLAARWRVIRYDRRGDGDSDPGAPESHTFATYVQDALAVLDAAGCERALVCGMAFGARVAMRLARDYPERVTGLMLFDATGGPPAPEPERRAGQEEAARLRAAAGLSPVQIDRVWFHRRDPAGARLNAHALAADPGWIEGMDRVRAPTLIACGEQDPNLAGSRRLAGEIPNAGFAAMPMTGHASMLERPHLVLSLLQGFADEVYG